MRKVGELRKVPCLENMLFKFGIDDGQGDLKINLSMIQRNAQFDPEKKKFEQSLLDRGVKKCFMITHAPAKESYDNVRILLEKVAIHKFDYPFIITADLKLVATACGMSNAGTCGHPCPLCVWPKATRPSKSSNGKYVFKKYDKRTFASMNDWHQKWKDETKSKKSVVGKYMNCVAEPLLVTLDVEKLVMDIFACPTVHLFTGCFNKMFQELEKIYSKVKRWATRLYVKRKKYHGKTFEGPQCKKMLNNLDTLKDLIKGEKGKLSAICEKYVLAFEALDSVVSACFGQFLDPSYPRALSDFQRCYLDLGISVTTKAHYMLEHVDEYIQREGVGLGWFSEQTAEAIHADLKKKWNHYKVLDTKSEVYHQNYLAATLSYNADHV